VGAASKANHQRVAQDPTTGRDLLARCVDVVWGTLGDSPELVCSDNPVAKLDHAKREIVATRFYEIPAEAIEQVRIRREHDAIYR